MSMPDQIFGQQILRTTQIVVRFQLRPGDTQAAFSCASGCLQCSVCAAGPFGAQLRSTAESEEAAPGIKSFSMWVRLFLVFGLVLSPA